MEMRQLFTSVRACQKDIERETFRFILKNVLNREVRSTRHFREWFKRPMNYARIMELPVTMHLLKADKEDRILDVSSPKLLALYYASKGFTKVVAADIEEYFVNDFNTYRERTEINVETRVFDATKRIPFPKDHFDKIFSISVLEHIPHGGDRQAIIEMLHVLKTDGIIVVTLPAFSKYVEEWISSRTFYWKSTTNEKGKFFYQRRYDRDAIYARLRVDNGEIEEVLLIGEKPIRESCLDSSGKMLHNSYYIHHVNMARWIKGIGRRLKVLPFTTYLAEKFVSQKYHYLTTDWSDPNIRQVAIKIRKRKSSEPMGGADA